MTIFYTNFSCQLRGLCPSDYPDVVCRGNYSFHTYDPPLLYNLHTDPGELYALDSKSTEYTDVMTEIQKVLIYGI